MAPDPKRNREAEEARLRALQMADLGTARREYISTTDDTRQRIAAMDEIERHRHSNIPGTVEQRRAQQNQASLSAWTNFHRTAADTGRVEQLDDLMHGQSHRAQLNASLHGNEAPRHPAGGHARARSFSHAPTHHHHPYAQPSSGRGGGVVEETLPMLVHTSRLLAGQPDEILRWIPTIQMIQPPVQLEAGEHTVAIVVETPTPLIGLDCPRSDREDLHPHLHPRDENYAGKLTNPADFLANARASFPLPAVSSGASSSLPPKPPTAPKPMTSKPAMAPNLAIAPKATATPKPPTTPKVMTPKPVMVPKPVMTPKPATAPKPVMAPKATAPTPAMGPKPVMTPQSATNPKTVQKSSLADSMYATPGSLTPVASAAHNVPGSSSPSRRIVPLEKTAGFSSRAKATPPKPSDEPKPADEPKPIDERQKVKEREEPAAVLLDIDQDEEANAETETQMRNLLLSPGMEELTGITFPKEDEPFLSADTQEQIARQLVQLLGYIQDSVGSSQAAHPLGERSGPVTATSLVVIEAIAKKVVEEWSQKRRAASKPPEEEAAPGPSTPAPSQDQRSALRNMESMAPELETDQLGMTSIFDNYRTPPRSASATVTDSSDEKKQRNIDAASFLSPKKRDVSSELPTVEFESLRVSEGGNVRTASGEPLSLLDKDINPTPSKQVITKSATKPPILGSMKSSIFAGLSNATYQLNKAKVIGVRPSPSYRVHEQQSEFNSFPPAHDPYPSTKNMPNDMTDYSKAGTTSEENTTMSKAPRGAPVSQTIVRREGPSRSVSEAQRPTLVQSSSNIRKETSAKGTSPSAGSSSPPREMKSRALSGGIEHSKWADPALLRPAPFSTPQPQPQQRPRTELMSSRHSSTEDSTKPKVTFLGPPPYIPKRK
ncbi:hypothetical protein PoHVEF18_005945 [Penicillium ochrochloron]